jgi:hypothetical protein
MRLLPIARATARYAAPAPTALTQPYAISQQFAAKKQVAMAIAGYPDLIRVSDAEDAEQFVLPPADDGGAYRHAAYWVGIAARLLDSRRLGATASYYAQWSSLYPAASMASGSATKILAEAGNAVQHAVTEARAARFDSARTNEAQAIATRLYAFAQPAAILKAQSQDDGLIADLRRLIALSETLGKFATAATFGLGGVAILGVGWMLWKIVKKVKG